MWWLCSFLMIWNYFLLYVVWIVCAIFDASWRPVPIFNYSFHMSLFWGLIILDAKELYYHGRHYMPSDSAEDIWAFIAVVGLPILIFLLVPAEPFLPPEALFGLQEVLPG